jgi:hypothetical protein
MLPSGSLWSDVGNTPARMALLGCRTYVSAWTCLWLTEAARDFLPFDAEAMRR